MRVTGEELAALPLFRSLNRDDLRVLSGIADLARFGPDDLLFEQGDRLADLHILTAGFVVETRWLLLNRTIRLLAFPSRREGLPAKSFTSTRPERNVIPDFTSEIRPSKKTFTAAASTTPFWRCQMLFQASRCNWSNKLEPQ